MNFFNTLLYKNYFLSLILTPEVFILYRIVWGPRLWLGLGTWISIYLLWATMITRYIRKIMKYSMSRFSGYPKWTQIVLKFDFGCKSYFGLLPNPWKTSQEFRRSELHSGFNFASVILNRSELISHENSKCPQWNRVALTQ